MWDEIIFVDTYNLIHEVIIFAEKRRNYYRYSYVKTFSILTMMFDVAPKCLINHIYYPVVLLYINVIQ